MRLRSIISVNSSSWLRTLIELWNAPKTNIVVFLIKFARLGVEWIILFSQTTLIKWEVKRYTCLNASKIFDYFSVGKGEKTHLYWQLFNYQRLQRNYMSRHMTKPAKWPVHTAKTQISLGIRPVWSLSAWRHQSDHCPHDDTLGPQHMILSYMYPLSPLQRLIRLGGIRLGGCPGWSESSLGAQIILLVLSWGGSY